MNFTEKLKGPNFVNTELIYKKYFGPKTKSNLGMAVKNVLMKNLSKSRRVTMSNWESRPLTTK